MKSAFDSPNTANTCTRSSRSNKLESETKIETIPKEDNGCFRKPIGSYLTSKCSSCLVASLIGALLGCIGLAASLTMWFTVQPIISSTTTITTVTTVTTSTATTTTTMTTSTTSTSTISTTSTTVTTTTTTSTTSTVTTTTAPTCVPFWSMPSSVQTAYQTYSGVNTIISGDVSRSGCVWVRASSNNVDNIVFSIGSVLTTATGGCNQHFALSIMDASHVTVYGMCGLYDNPNINLGSSVLYDGSFHQLCVSYNNINSQLCIYLDLSSPVCIIRTNSAYNTGAGDVRVGWWVDLNRQFVSTGFEVIQMVSLFNIAINQSCATYMYQTNIPLVG